MTTVDTKRYFAIPFTPAPERASVVSAIMRGVCEFETVFNDYNKPCESVCGECESCLRARVIVARNLSHPDSRTWEVWSMEDDQIVGILTLTRVIPGVDATAHYVFFDRKLTDKTELLESMIEWALTDHEDWVGLNRITVEIPVYAFATARHAYKKLGFGGDFVYRHKGKQLDVEGVRRAAFRWRGTDCDVLQLGRVR